MPLSEVMNMLVVGCPVLFRQQHFKRLGDNLLRLVAEDPRGVLAKEGDILFSINGDNGIFRNIDNPGQPALMRLQRCGHHVKGLGQLAKFSTGMGNVGSSLPELCMSQLCFK